MKEHIKMKMTDWLDQFMNECIGQRVLKKIMIE